MKKFVPVYEGELRKHSIQVPRCISECSGIRIFGRRIKSLVFSTDVAIIKNINADASSPCIPLRPSRLSHRPFCRCRRCRCLRGGGGLTNGQRSASIAAYAEHQGAFGLVCNTFITEEPFGPSKRRWRSRWCTRWCRNRRTWPESWRRGGFPQRIRGGPDAGDRGPYPGAVPGGSHHATGGPTDDTIRATIELGPMPSPTRRPPALSCFPRVCGNTGAGLRKGLRRSRKMKRSAPTAKRVGADLVSAGQILAAAGLGLLCQALLVHRHEMALATVTRP